MASLNDSSVTNYLRELPVERLAAILQVVFQAKQPFPEEARFCRNRFYLGTATSDLESEEKEPERWSPWVLKAVASVDQEGPDWGLCQSGSCGICGTEVRSNIKNAICPICVGDV